MPRTIRSIKSQMAVPIARKADTNPWVTGTKTVGQVLTCHEGLWTGGGGQTFAYQWENKVVASGVVSNCLGAGNGAAAYTLGAGDQTDLVRCKVTCTDDAWGDTVAYTEWTTAIA